jgi:ankyrin repeat protein
MQLYQQIVNFMQDRSPDEVVEPEIFRTLSELDVQDKHYIMRKSSEMGHLSILKALLALDPELDIDDTDSRGNTALLHAAANGQAEIVRFLLSQGADKSVITIDGRSALNLAITLESLPTCRALLEAGVKHEKMMLHYFFRVCLHEGHEMKILPFVRLFLEAHVDLNETDSLGVTALGQAIKVQASKKIIEELLIHHANCNLMDANGLTPFLYACKDAALEIVNLLIEHGADIHKCDKKGNTSLILACQNKDPGIAARLLSLGVGIDKSNRAKETPLIVAIKYRQEEIAKFLIDSQANVNLADKKKLTPIYFAAFSRNRSLCQYLLKNGVHKEDMETAESQLDPLPVFTYFASAELCSEIENTSQPCDCCKKRPGCLLKTPLIDNNDNEEVVCPWCISTGKAAQKFKIHPNCTELADEDTIHDQTAIEELKKRTPPFTTWQDNFWLTHCGLPCQYKGRVGWKEIEALFPQIEIGEIHCTGKKGPEFHVREKKSDLIAFLISSLHKEGSCTGYLFRCVKCHQLSLYFDLA